MAAKRLSVGAQGPEVATLQSTLGAFGLVIPWSETSQAFFGSATMLAVQRVQRQNRLPATGILDADTATVLSSKAAAPGASNESTAIPAGARSAKVSNRSTQQESSIATSTGPRESSPTVQAAATTGIQRVPPTSAADTVEKWLARRDRV
jgi:peptidoglycan hydrolase-like protein with peptidoglycan-binding domain